MAATLLYPRQDTPNGIVICAWDSSRSYCDPALFSHLDSISVEILTNLNTNGCAIFTPPRKPQGKLYKCNSTFEVGLLLDMYKTGTKYGLAYITDKCAFYEVNISGTHMDLTKLSDNTFERVEKQQKGGQSAHRFQANADIQHSAQDRKIAAKCVEHFVCKSEHGINVTIEGIIVLGPGTVKDNVMRESDFNTYLGKRVLSVMTTDSLSDSQIREFAFKHKHLFKPIGNARKAHKFFDMIQSNSDRLVFGLRNIERCLQSHAIESVLLQDGIHIDCIDNCTDVTIVNDPRLERDYQGVIAIVYQGREHEILLDDDDLDVIQDDTTENPENIV